jgi:hypothetical protein
VALRRCGFGSRVFGFGRQNDAFIPHCVDGLMLNVAVRKEVEPAARATTQRNYAEI